MVGALDGQSAQHSSGVASGQGSVTYSVWEGDSLLGQASVSQGTAPSGLSADGATWQWVKTVRLAGGTLTVRLTDGGLPGDLVAVMAADAV